MQAGAPGIQFKEGLQKQLDQIRTVTFPATAIELLYQDFVANINNNGVAKAHGIVKHGHNYQGTDKKIKNLIAECDPNAAKWLTEVKKYRTQIGLNHECKLKYFKRW